MPPHVRVVREQHVELLAERAADGEQRAQPVGHPGGAGGAGQAVQEALGLLADRPGAVVEAAVEERLVAGQAEAHGQAR